MNSPRRLPSRLGKYEVVRLLGEGGMGVVYEGFDPQIRRQVALKAIKPAAGPDEQERLDRFLREAQAAGRLLHPRIVMVYEYSEDVTIGTDGGEERTPFIAMEYVQGQDLKRLLRDKDKQGERLPLAQVQQIMSGLLDALAYSHENRVVHRDIKPANIIVLPEGNIKVTDFGVARLLEHRDTASFTQHGAVLGTLSYVAPEQFRGDPVDGRTDVYAAGVVLYELLTGTLPFTGTTEELMYKVLNETPELPSRFDAYVPRAYDAVIERALAKRPSERFQSAADFLRALPPLEAAVLPPDVVALVQHELPELKLAGVLRLHVLLDSGTAPLVLAARQALERLQNDPNPAVAGAAIHVLQSTAGARKPGPQPGAAATMTRHAETLAAPGGDGQRRSTAALLRQLRARWMLAGALGVLGVVGATLVAQSMHANNPSLTARLAQAPPDSSRPLSNDAHSSSVASSSVAPSSVAAVAAPRPPEGAADGQRSDQDSAQAAPTSSEPPSRDAQSSSAPAAAPAPEGPSAHRSAPRNKHGRAPNPQHRTDEHSSSTSSVTKNAPVAPPSPPPDQDGPPAPQRPAPNPNPRSPNSPPEPSPAPPAPVPRQRPPVFPEPEMVHLPAGSFVMGSPAKESWRSSDEGPQHTVHVAAFSIGKYAVTFEEWDRCVAQGGCMPAGDHRSVSDPGSVPGPKGGAAGAGSEVDRGRRPVSNVSWEDAQHYVSWLSQKTGKLYRLPTEAEWEYAARAGSTTAYYWGESIGSQNANCRDCGSRWGGVQTAPVGSFAPNPWGLFDMAGNVFQWTQDCYHKSYEDAPADGSAWELGCSAGRVARGGAWGSDLHKLRSAYRIWHPPGNRSGSVGFRVARSD